MKDPDLQISACKDGGCREYGLLKRVFVPFIQDNKVNSATGNSDSRR